jgi:uncharacterized protein with NRDE domain
MCTALLFFEVFPDLPIVIAANRDEFLDRPSLAPRRISDAPRIVCGIDEKKGGTWFGVTDERFVALLTNQPPVAPIDPPGSRGDVVLEVLRIASVDGARDFLQRLDTSTVRGFNLLFGDSQGLMMAYAREGVAGVEFEVVKSGFHVLTSNARLDPTTAKGALAARGFDDEIRRIRRIRRASLDCLIERLRSHETPAGPLSAICIHTPMYGTVSAQIVALANDGVRHHLYVDGKPCERAPEDVRDLHTPKRE